MKEQRVWKYEIPFQDEFILPLRLTDKPLYVDVQDGTPCLWVLTCPNDEVVDGRRFRLAGTGHPITDALTHIGSFQLHGGKLVFHLFEVGGD